MMVSANCRSLAPAALFSSSERAWYHRVWRWCDKRGIKPRTPNRSQPKDLVKIVGRIKHVLEQTEEAIKKNDLRVEIHSVTDYHHAVRYGES